MDARTRTYVAGGAIMAVILLLLFRRRGEQQIIQEAAGQAIFQISGPVINTYQLPALPDIIFPPFAGGDIINFQLPSLGGDGFDISKLFQHAFDWMQTTDLACSCGDSAYTPAVWITVKEPIPPTQTQFVYLTPPPVLPSQSFVMKPAAPATTVLHFAKAGSSMSVG